MGSRSIDEAIERLTKALDALEEAALASVPLRRAMRDTVQVVDEVVETMRTALGSPEEKE